MNKEHERKIHTEEMQMTNKYEKAISLIKEMGR